MHRHHSACLSLPLCLLLLTSCGQQRCATCPIPDDRDRPVTTADRAPRGDRSAPQTTLAALPADATLPADSAPADTALAGANQPLSAEQQPLERIAFGSCANQEKPQPIWRPILDARPDLFIMLGDNIYGDTEDMDVLRAKYAKLGAQPGFQRLRQTIPLLATWDDHDYGRNDAGREYPQREASQRVFLDFFGDSTDSPRRHRPGVYNAYRFGPAGKQVQVILLDTRYFRSPLKKDPNLPENRERYIPNDDPDATMLGDEQWAWLREQLSEPAELRIIASSIQVVPEDHRSEKWSNLPRERQRLFDLIRDTKAAGVVFISGDRHLAEISMIDGGVGYPLYDVTASSLTHSSHKWHHYEKNRHRVGTMNMGENFGLISIDWSRDNPLLRLAILDAEGDIYLQLKLPLSTLQPGVIKGQ